MLVVACPCALILATPAAVLASMAWLARHGVLIKGGAALERLAACDTFAFDKTGTLTRGRPELAGIVPLGGTDRDRRCSAWPRPPRRRAGTRWPSPSPREAARRGLDALRRARGRRPARRGRLGPLPLDDGRPRARRSSSATAGCWPSTASRSTPRPRPRSRALDARGETPLFVAVDGRVVGLIGARDAVRPEAHDVIHDLKHLKITEIAILTGDRASAAQARREEDAHQDRRGRAACPPTRPRWIEERQAAGRQVAMVGDGINDAPALATAHAGIALAGIGADLAAEAGDLVILGEPLRVLPDLVKLSRATVAVIRQNIIIFAFGLNAVAMALGGPRDPRAGRRGDPPPGGLAPRPAERDAAARVRRLGEPRRRSASSARSAARSPARRPPRPRARRRTAARPLADRSPGVRLGAGDAGLRHLGLDGDRARRGRAAAAAGAVSRHARAGPAPALAAAVRDGSPG